VLIIDESQSVDNTPKSQRAIRTINPLFFIDHVAIYRSYDDDGSPVKGKIAHWFEDAYAASTSRMHQPFTKC